ncbi:9235_t:CDS:2, partial [Acaulospora colombiana]
AGLTENVSFCATKTMQKDAFMRIMFLFNGNYATLSVMDAHLFVALIEYQGQTRV